MRCSTFTHNHPNGFSCLYVEEARTGRNTLAAVSLRKEKGAWTAP